MDILIVVNRMVILVILMGIGFLCSKVGITNPDFTRTSSKVLMEVLMPAVILNAALETTMELAVTEILWLMAIPFGMMIICLVVANIVPRLIKMPEINMGMAIFMVLSMNTNFVGLPIIDSLYGVDGIFYASLANVSYSIFVFSVGVVQLNRGGEFKIKPRQVLCNAVLAALLGALLIATGWSLPETVEGVVGYLGNATVAVSMLIVGTSLGAVDIKKAVKNWRTYILCFARLIICPVITYFVFSIFVDDAMLLGVLTILAGTPVAMVATVMAIEYKKDEHFASETVFMSTIFSAVTLPLIVWAFL